MKVLCVDLFLVLIGRVLCIGNAAGEDVDEYVG